MRSTVISFVICICFVSANANVVPVIRAGIFNYVVESFNQFTNFVQDTLSVVMSSTDIDSNCSSSGDSSLNITQLTTKYGYPIEEHRVITEDGFVITLHRIPRGRTNVTNNLVIFLMHGLIESSDSWVLQGPNKALAYILADEGFDVWMGNARGNKYAREHLTLDPNDNEFWGFTWEEIGQYDLPSMIDYALHVTSKENLYFVGYSQGTTSFYVLSSLKPEYNKKIKMMFALAPVAFLANVRSPLIKMFSSASEFLAYFLINYNVPNTDMLSSVVQKFCTRAGIACQNIMSMIVGHDSKHLTDTMSVLLGHTPTTSSTLQLVHYGQLVNSGRFCQFDYGEEMNLKTYGTKLPPDFDLSKVTVPNVIFFCENDWLAVPLDVKTLLTQLPDVYGSHYIEDFNHLDLVYATAAKDAVYSKIVNYVLNYEDNKAIDQENNLKEINTY